MSRCEKRWNGGAKFAAKLLLATAAIMLVGCASQPAKDDRPKRVDYTTVGQAMDKVESRIAEFGSISVSSPMLAPANTPGFLFSLKTGPDDYYNHARTDVNARAGQAFSSARSSGFGLSIQGDLSGLISPPVPAAPPAPAAPAAAPAVPSTPSLPAVTDASAASADAVASKVAALPGLLKLLGDDAPVALNDRDAIMQAASNTAVQGIVGLLSDPQRLSFKDKKIVLGVAMVSVEPGWQTQRNFAADVSVLCSYQYLPARTERVQAYINDVFRSAASKDDKRIIELGRVTNIGEKISANYLKYKIALQWLELAKIVKDLSAELTTPAQAELLSKARVLVESHDDSKPPFQRFKKKLDEIDNFVNAASEVTSAAETTAAASAIESNPSSADLQPPFPAKFDIPGAIARFQDLRAKIEPLFTKEELDDAGKIPAKPTSPPESKPKEPSKNAPTAELMDTASALAPSTESAVSKQLQQQMKLNLTQKNFSSSNLSEGVSTSTSATNASNPLIVGLPVEESNPVVAAVSPLMDTDTVDLSNSIRQSKQTALKLALALQYMGIKGEAQAFNDYAESLGRDVDARSSLPTMTVYSHSGGMFGFQIGPRLRGLNVLSLTKSASKNNTRADFALDRQTIPVLVIIGMDQRDLDLRFDYHDGAYLLMEPAIKFTQASRWLPIEQSMAGAVWLESDRLSMATNLADGVAHLPMSQADFDKTLQWIDRARKAITAANTVATTAANVDGSHSAAGIDFPALFWARTFLEGARNRNEPGLDRQLVDNYRKTIARLKFSCDATNKTETWKIDGLLEPSGQIPNVCDALGAVLSQRMVLSPGAADDYIRTRATMLEYHALGSINSQDIPLDVVVTAAAPEKTPAITQIIPAAVTVSSSGDATTDQVFTIAVTGANLKGIKPADVKYRTSKKSPTTAPTGTPDISDSAITLNVSVTRQQTPDSLWVELTYQTATGETKKLISPPVQILPPDLMNVTFDVNADNKDTKRTLSAPTNATPETIKAVVGDEKKSEKKKDRDGKNDAKVDMTFQLKAEQTEKAPKPPAPSPAPPARK